MSLAAGEMCTRTAWGTFGCASEHQTPSGSPFVTLPFGLHFVLRFAIARGTMAEQKFQDIWKEQCVAARSVRAQHGILSALDYLVGEKLLIYAETAVTRQEFARG